VEETEMTFRQWLTTLEPRTTAERRIRVAIAVLLVILCFSHATVLLLDDHVARMMYAALGARYLSVMYGEYGIGFFILWLLFIHFIRPDRPQ
jgi:hypothetical protein